MEKTSFVPLFEWKREGINQEKNMVGDDESGSKSF